MPGFSKHFQDERLDEEGSLLPEFLTQAQLDVGETEEVKGDALRELRELIEGEDRLKARLDEEFLLRFLRSTHYNVDSAFRWLKSYYRTRRNYPEIFDDFLPSKMAHLFGYNCFTLLPKLDARGSPIVIFKASEYTPEYMSTEESVRATLLAAEVFFQDPLVNLRGFVFVVDCSGSCLYQIRANPMTKIRRYMPFTQKVLPLEIRAIHVVNESAILGLAYSIIKPFLPLEIKQKIHFHGKNYQSLYRYIPEEILPEEYGGDQEAVDMQPCIDIVIGSEDFFKLNAEFGYKDK